MDTIVVEVTRGDVVEARHIVHAVAVRDGRVELALGDHRLVTFLRSSAKPIQALPVVRARPDLDDEQVALLCASHLAAPEQLAIVRRILADAPATEDDLECGADPTPIEHNCSGKHAGFLALCIARGWPTQGYRHAGHPCQRTVLEEVVEAAGAAPVATAVDGCGVPTFAFSLERAASLLTRLPMLDGGAGVVRSIRGHPDLLRGPDGTDVVLVRELDGWVAKGGAEGLLCAASPDGLGLALKVVDGAFRAIQPAVAHVLELLGYAPGRLADDRVVNSHGETVGAFRVARSG